MKSRCPYCNDLTIRPYTFFFTGTSRCNQCKKYCEIRKPFSNISSTLCLIIVALSVLLSFRYNNIYSLLLSITICISIFTIVGLKTNLKTIENDSAKFRIYSSLVIWMVLIGIPITLYIN